jgi:predicted metalloendopeptidase
MKSEKNIKNKIKHNKTQKKKVICNQLISIENDIEEKFKKDFKNSSLGKNFNLETYLLKLLNDFNKKYKITPQDDFYSYINEQWLQTYNPSAKNEYIIKLDDFRLIQDKVYRDLEKIVHDYVKEHKDSKSPFDISFINFYKSCLRHYRNNRGDSAIIKRAEENLQVIDELLANNDMLKLLAWFNSNEIISWGSPIIWGIKADSLYPSIYRSFITGPTLSIRDVSVYFDDETNVKYKNIYRNEYFKYLNQLFVYFFGKNHNFNVKDVFTVETEIANAFACYKFKTHEYTKYNKITAEESLKKYNFDWITYSKYLGFKTPPEFYCAADINYLSCIIKILSKEWNTNKWRTYWIYIYIRNLARFNNESSNIYYNFNAVFQKGAVERPGFDLFMIFPLGYAFNSFLSTQYIKKYKNDEYINYVETLGEDLKKVYYRILKRNEWLSPLTKQKAIQKLYHIKIIVGTPKNLDPDAILDYNDKYLWLNLVKISKWRHKRAVSLEGKKYIELPVVDWTQAPPEFVTNQAYIVNASYTPSNNSVYIPLGYIQKPFIDLDQRGIEYNLAYIGFTIAHELGHALDDWGSRYDSNGILNEWWTEKDKKVYANIQKDIVKQLETFASYDGVKYDGWLNISELIADIVGFTICREYLRDYLYTNKVVLPAAILSLKLFYAYIALQHRQKISKTSVINEVLTNPHPLAKYRTNLILSRSKVFRALYDIKKGDKMWWPSTNRVWEK